MVTQTAAQTTSATVATTAVAFTASNDVPTIGSVGQTVTYTEQTPVAIDADLTVGDVDSSLLKSATVKITNVKTRQQLEQERESFFQSTVKRVQEEATMISNRAKEDEMKRVEFLKGEEERIMREEKLRQEAIQRAEEERKQKELERQEMLKKQQLEFKNQREEMERQNLMKRQKEEEERRRFEMQRIEEERKRQVVHKSEKVVMEEKNSHLEELQRQDELRRLEKQRLEQMIIQGKIRKGIQNP